MIGNFNYNVAFLYQHVWLGRFTFVITRYQGKC